MADAKQFAQLIEQVGYLTARLEVMPEVIPIARTILGRVLNGQDRAPKPRTPRPQVPRAPQKPKRKMSAARRKQLSVAAKARWAKAKKAGKKTIGGSE